jgi:hypothetical protein
MEEESEIIAHHLLDREPEERKRKGEARAVSRTQARAEEAVRSLALNPSISLVPRHDKNPIHILERFSVVNNKRNRCQDSNASRKKSLQS